MPRPTTASEITRLELQLTKVREEIEQVRATKEMEEGGSGARFRTVFTSINDLEKIETIINNKLTVLYGYTS